MVDDDLGAGDLAQGGRAAIVVEVRVSDEDQLQGVVTQCLDGAEDAFLLAGHAGVYEAGAIGAGKQVSLRYAK